MGHILKCLFDTAYIVCSSQDVDELIFKLANYHYFCSGLTQEDTFEGLMLLIGVMDKGFVPFSTDNYISDRDSLFELLF